MCEPYETLGVKPSASAAEIHAAFRRLAMQWHPDRNPLPTATQRFQEIAAAYDTLKDPVRRAQYDAAHVHERREQSQQQARQERQPRQERHAAHCPCRPMNPEAARIWAEAEAAMRITPDTVINAFHWVEARLRCAFAS